MWVNKVLLNNIRSYENETINFSKGINILVGPNNGGKSTLAYVPLYLQDQKFGPEDVRAKNANGKLTIFLTDADDKYFHGLKITSALLELGNGGSIRYVGIDLGGNQVGLPSIKKTEPDNFIYPYLAKRKVVTFSEGINIGASNQVSGDLSNLYAKVDRLCTPEIEAHAEYVDACQNALGFVVSSLTSQNGKKPCYIIDNFRNVPVDKMGEGVTSILGLITDLCVAKDKLFIMEEPENDIHPKALKVILQLIAKKAVNNQFIITTHSNIVVTNLGSLAGSNILNINLDFNSQKLPTSHVEAIENIPEKRMEILNELGYELPDVELWEAWMFLEEASAEKIIRNYLIPWFTPNLKYALKTYSSRTVNEVELKFEKFNMLFAFLNMQPAYKNRAWVYVDGGDEEKLIIDRLKDTYKSWDQLHFRQFKEHDFERYYPEKFRERVETILALKEKKDKRQKKKELLEELELWIEKNLEEAKESFKKSASEVIDELIEIEKSINS